MNHKIRNLILSILTILLFGSVLVWALLAANGRRIDISNDDPTIVQTGGLRINNDEYKNRLRVLIDSQVVDINEDNIIANIEPGEHEVVLQIDGYQDWQSKINVEPGILTDIYPYLFPNELKLETVTRTNIDKAFFSPSGDYVYYVISKSNRGSDNGIFKLNLNPSNSIFNNTSNTPIKIMNIRSEIKPAVESGNYEFIISPDNRRFVFKSELSDPFIVDSDNLTFNLSEQNPLLNLKAILGYIPSSFEWFRGSSSLIIENNDVLAELVLNSQKILLISNIPDQKPIYGINGDTLIFYSPYDKLVYRWQNEIKTRVILENRVLPGDITEILIDKWTGKTMVYKVGETYYYANIEESFVTEVGTNINLLAFSNDGFGITFTKDSNLYTFVVEDIKALNEFETKESLVIENYDPQVHTVKWSSNANHLLLSEKVKANTLLYIIDKKAENRIKILESDRIINNSYHTLQNNQEFYVLLQDSASTETELAKNNLYKIMFNIEI